MTKKLNFASLMLLTMPWHHVANAGSAIYGTAVPSRPLQARCMSVMGGYAPVPGQKNTFTSVTVGCGVPAPSGFTQQLPAGATVVKVGVSETSRTVNPTSSAAPFNPQAVLPQPNVSQIKWHAMGYRYPDGHGGMVHVDEQDRIFYIFVNGQKMSSGPVRSGQLQKRPPMYIVYDWLLKKWQANRNDNASYYLAPTAECALSRNMSIGPDGALSVQLVPQPKEIDNSIQWSAYGYNYLTYGKAMVHVNEKTGKSYLESPDKVKFDLPDVPADIRRKRPAQASPIANGPSSNRVMPVPVSKIVAG